jgi:dihydrofolate reductase
VRIGASEFLSQDAVVEDPGGREGCARGGWASRWHNREIDEHKTDELFGADAMLLGPVTYEAYAAARPFMTDEDGFADRMNTISKFVVSSTLQTAARNNLELLSGDVIAAVPLKRRPGRDLLVAGSATLVRALACYGLVDLYRFPVYPVALGSGRPFPVSRHRLTSDTAGRSEAIPAAPRRAIKILRAPRPRPP